MSEKRYGKRKLAKVTKVKIVDTKRRNKKTSKMLTTRIPRGFGNPVAQRTFAWLNYVDVNTLATNASGAVADRIYNLNSIFDPDRTIGASNHQPYGHDNYQLLYQRYRVHKFKYNVRATMYTSAGIGAMSVVPLNNVTAQTSHLNLEEQTNSFKTKLLNYNGESNCSFSGIVDLCKLNGASKSEYNSDDRFEAQFGADPTELMGLHICLSNPSGVAFTVTFVAKLAYYVEMFDPIQLAQS